MDSAPRAGSAPPALALILVWHASPRNTAQFTYNSLDVMTPGRAHLIAA